MNKEENKKASQKREPYVVKGADAFVDGRGRIENYYLSEAIGWIGFITSKERGLLRANHYHPEQLQQVLVTKGGYISVWKDLGDRNAKIRHHLVQAGDLEIMPPNIAHAMIFIGETEFLNLVNGERKHENFGKHTISYEVVTKDEVEKYLKEYLTH